MQKLFATLTILLSLLTFSYAQQTVASDFYLMKNNRESVLVLKAINSQLNLSEEKYNQVKELLSASAKSQEEQLASSPDAERVNIIKARQTAHIETNLKNILGQEQYDLYLQKKAAMAAQLKDLQKN